MPNAAFAPPRRDWSLVEESKARYWADEATDPMLRFRVSDALYRHAKSLHPGWPSEAEREEDLAVHTRVSAALRSVSRPPSR